MARLNCPGRCALSAVFGLLWLVCGSAAADTADLDTRDATEVTQNEPTPPDQGAPYRLGQGYRLGNSGFTLGGYSSVQYENLENADARAALSHLSMFVWWEGESHIRFFSEIDSEHQLSADTQTSDTDGRFLSVERLYFEYAVNDALSVRLGKFLTPIGHWNQVHADPLVWTTSRPVITVSLFPDHTTGVMANGNLEILGHQAEYNVFTSFGTDVHRDPAEDPFNEAVGARLNIGLGENLQWGFSAASFDQISTSEEQETLFGTDFVWSFHGAELSGEGVYRKSSLGGSHDAYGGFIQAAVPIYKNWYAVGRVESIHDLEAQQDANLYVLGLNYRPNRAVSLKAEFIRGLNQDISAPGFLTSISVLF